MTLPILPATLRGAAAELRASAALPTPVLVAAPLTVADVIEMIERGEIAYAPANKRRVLGSLRKCAEVYGLPLDRISADIGAFEARWGRGRVTSYDPTCFSSANHVRDWRSNCRGAFATAAGAPTARAERNLRDDAWAELLALFASLSDVESGHAEYDPRIGISLRRLAEIGRLAGVGPDAMTTAILVAARDAMPTANQQASVARMARRFDGLRADLRFARFMPLAPVGPLPALRAPRRALEAILPRAVLNAFEAWLEAMPSEAAPISGAVVGHSTGYVGQIRAAFAWYVRRLEALGRLGAASPRRLADLCRLDWVSAAAQAELKMDGRTRLKPRSLSTYLSRILRLCADHGVDVSRYRRDPAVRRTKGLAPDRLRFCKRLLAEPRLKQLFFDAPDLLKARAEKALARGDEQAAIRAGVTAVAKAVNTRVAPLRAENVVSLRHLGEGANLHLERADRTTLISFAAEAMKNGKPFEAPFLGEYGRRCPRAMIDWFVEIIRPLMLKRAGQSASDWLFPAVRGHMSYKVYRDAYRIETAEIGLPMTPHMDRHGVATLMLDHDPTCLARVASLLGDEQGTVLAHYGWIDKVKHVVEAQRTLLDTIRCVETPARRAKR